MWSTRSPFGNRAGVILSAFYARDSFAETVSMQDQRAQSSSEIADGLINPLLH